MSKLTVSASPTGKIENLDSANTFLDTGDKMVFNPLTGNLEKPLISSVDGSVMVKDPYLNKYRDLTTINNPKSAVNTSKITTDDIKNAPTLNTGSFPPADTKSTERTISSVSGTSNYYQSLIEESNKKEDEARKAQGALGAKPGMDTTGKRTELETQYGISNLTQTQKEQAVKVATLQAEIDKVKLLEQDEIGQARQQLANVPTYVVDRQVNEINRKYASQLAYKAVEMGQEAMLLNIYSGNLTEAKNQIKDVVDAYAYDQTQKRSDYDKLYDMYGDWIESLDKTERELIEKGRSEAIAQEKEAKDDAQKILELRLKYPKAAISLEDGLKGAYDKATQYEAQNAINMNSYLANQGLPLNIINASGELTDTVLQQTLDNGVPYDVAVGLWENMKSGNSFEEIRQGMKAQGIDTAYLDNFVQALQY